MDSNNTKAYKGTELEDLSNARNYIKWIMNCLNPFLKGTVLEVGAGVGTFAKQVEKNKRIETIMLIEPDKKMANKLNEIFNNKKVSIMNTFAKTVSKTHENKFDCIYYINCLEHIEYDIDEINTAYKLLKPNGYICIFVPAFQSLYSQFDKDIQHFRRYTKSSLKKCFNENNFTIKDIFYMDIIGFFLYFIAQKLLKLQPNPLMISVFDSIVVPTTQVCEKLFFKKKWVPFGKSLFLVAQKK